MNSEYDHDPELEHLLDGPAWPASAETLEAIVARGRRGRERALAGGLVLALVAGPVGGFLIAREGNGGGQQITAAAAPEVATAAVPSVAVVDAAGPGIGGPGMKKLTPRETAAGVRVPKFRPELGGQGGSQDPAK